MAFNATGPSEATDKRSISFEFSLIDCFYDCCTSGKSAEFYRNQLGSFGLSGELAVRPVASLSGGQKSRVAFALMSMLKWVELICIVRVYYRYFVEIFPKLNRSFQKFSFGVESFVQRFCDLVKGRLISVSYVYIYLHFSQYVLSVNPVQILVSICVADISFSSIPYKVVLLTYSSRGQMPVQGFEVSLIT